MKYGKIEQVGKFRRDSRSVYNRLCEYEQAGCMITLDGKEALPEEVATTCLRENVSYMVDYIPSEDCPYRLSAINFTLIRQEDGDMQDQDYESLHSNIATYEGWCS